MSPAVAAASGPAKAVPQSRNMNLAKAAKNDEFYTQIGDIEDEMDYYHSHFVGKVVFCNCDDPDMSHFWQYFRENFHFLKLRGLISTHYDRDGNPSYKSEYDGKNKTETPLKGDGDFRSPECVALLKKADIVMTNPPFSLFRDFLAQLQKYNKKFLVIGNMNAFNYKEIRPLILNGEVWMGCNSRLWFRVPADYSGPKSSVKTDKDGNTFINITSAWFTNLEHNRRAEELLLTASYKKTPQKYREYENYRAIEVGKVKDIPKDYKGKMGVPISFLLNHNPDQFEIVGFDRDVLPGGGGRFELDGRQKYARLVIRRKRST